MSAASVSLESLQILLQHMDANRRFEIYNRCPSLREIEKSIPLKINSLSFSQSCVIVNGMTYQIGIIRKYNRETPKYAVASNERGGLSYEVDKHGVRDDLDECTITPGDLEIRRLTMRTERQIEQDNIGFVEEYLHRFEQQLALLRERRPNRYPMDVDLLENAIEFARAKLFEYLCRRENVPPIFEHFFQLTTSRVVDNQEHRTIERYVHNKKHSEAMKQLTTVLIGGRSCPIFVKEITFNRQNVIRLPIGIKFRIEQLDFKAASGKKLKALAPIFHESSFPLKKLSIRALSVADVTDPIVGTAEELKIGDIAGRIQQLLPVITNQRVHITTSLREESLKELIGNWIESQRPIGTEYIIGLYRKNEFANEMEDILKSLNGVSNDHETVVIPVSDAAQLRVSYGPFPEFAPCSKWAVKLLNEAVEN